MVIRLDIIDNITSGIPGSLKGRVEPEEVRERT